MGNRFHKIGSRRDGNNGELYETERRRYRSTIKKDMLQNLIRSWIRNLASHAKPSMKAICGRAAESLFIFLFGTSCVKGVRIRIILPLGREARKEEETKTIA